MCRKNDIASSMWFTSEFDAYIHESCIRERVQTLDDDDVEGRLIAKEFGLL